MKRILGISQETTFGIWFMIIVSVGWSFYNSNLWYVVGVLILYYVWLIYYFNFVLPNKPFKIIMVGGNFKVGEIISPGGKGGRYKIIHTKLNSQNGYMELTVRKVKDKTKQ